MVKAILFDLDGSLLDRRTSLIDFVRWQVQGMLHNDVDAAQQFISRFIELDADGVVWKDKVYQILNAEFSIANWSMLELLLNYELCFCAFVKPRKGMIELVAQCRYKGIKLAGVSNGKSPFQQRNFRALGCVCHFDEVIISEQLGLRKPDAAIFTLACKRLQVSLSETVVIGDSIAMDIEGAFTAGIRSIYFPNDSNFKCDLANAVCSDSNALLDIILKLDYCKES